jgi:predicted amidophosphoribosyltransferase
MDESIVFYILIGLGVGFLYRLAKNSSVSLAQQQPASTQNLIPCPDCGRQVSKLAASCPSCGRPMAIEVPPIQGKPASLR